jgi:hypothetical protein
MNDTRGELIDTIAHVDRVIAGLQAFKAELVVHADDVTSVTRQVTVKDPKAWNAVTIARKEFETELACALRIPERTAQNLITESRMLVTELPATKAALSTGEISYRHAQKIIDNAVTLSTEHRSQFENELLPFAARMTAAKFTTKARKHRERFHPETIAERRTAAIETRSVTYDPAPDGMGWLSALLPAEQALAIYGAVDEGARRLQGPDEHRTLTQLRADVFADELLGGDRLTGIVPTVLVTVPVLSMLGHSDEPAQLEGYGPIDVETACTLAGNSPTMTRLLTNPETGVVLSMGRDTYKVPTKLQRLIRYRDGTCRAPGCGAPARKADIDHLNDWADGGGTDYDNLYCLCPKHHKMKHNTSWKVRSLGNGILRWTSPDGKNYDTYPDNPIRPG